MNYIDLIQEIENLEHSSFAEKIDWFKRCYNNPDNEEVKDEIEKEIKDAVSRMAERIKEKIKNNALKRIKEKENE